MQRLEDVFGDNEKCGAYNNGDVSWDSHASPTTLDGKRGIGFVFLILLHQITDSNLSSYIQSLYSFFR